MNWFKKKTNTDEAYLHYKLGNIYEEPRTHRKQLNENDFFGDEIPSLPPAEDSKPTAQATPPAAAAEPSLESEGVSDEKLENSFRFGGRKWLGYLITILLLFFIYSGSSFAWNYMQHVWEANATELAANKNTVASFEWDIKAFMDKLKPDKQTTTTTDAVAQIDESAVTEAAAESVETDAATHAALNTASSLHANLIEQNNALKDAVVAYSTRQISRASLQGTSSIALLSLVTAQTTLDSLEEGALKSSLMARVANLKTFAEVVVTEPRTSIVAVANTYLEVEGTESLTTVAQIRGLLDENGIAYTEEGNTLHFSLSEKTE